MSVAEELGFDFSSEPCEQFLVNKWPCGKCLPCLHRRQQEWIARLCEELRNNDQNYFVTLTYADDKLPYDEYGQMCFDSKRIIKLHRDLRKRFQTGRFLNPVYKELSGSPQYLELPLDQSIKYYLTSEYCPTSTQRPHYHAVYFNLGIDVYTAELLFRYLWPDGFVTVYEAKEGAAGYISKYLCKDVLEVDSYKDDTRMSPIAIMSKGLGKSYIERMEKWHHDDPFGRQYYQFHGERKVLPRYYKNKLYNEYIREAMAEKFGRDTGYLKGRYQALQTDDPDTYVKLLQERRKYFDDQRDSERWIMLKKNKIK